MSDEMNNPELDENEQARTPLEQFFFHQRRALEETGKALESILPPGFREHTQQAGREFAQGFRVLVDAAIDEIKKASEMEDPEAKAREEAARQAESNLSNKEDDDDDDQPRKGKVKIELD